MNTTTMSVLIMVGLASTGIVGLDNLFLVTRPPINFSIDKIDINSDTGKIAVTRSTNVKKLTVGVTAKVQNTNTRETLCGMTMDVTIDERPGDVWGPYKLSQVVRDDCEAAYGHWVDLIIQAHWTGRDGSLRYDEAISNPFEVTDKFR